MKRAIFDILPVSVKNWLRKITVGVAPGDETSKGVSLAEWKKRQEEKELKHWFEEYPRKLEEKTPEGYYRKTYQQINVKMFNNLRLDCSGKKIVDLGCGPFGSLPLRNFSLFIGIEPLAVQLQARYGFPSDWLVMNSMAEKIPLKTATVDALYCINALDHFHSPYDALEDSIRVITPGGYYALSTDVGGTPGHPCKILEKDLDKYLVDSGRFEIIERRCSADINSSWPTELNIPLYVFQGIKKA